MDNQQPGITKEIFKQIFQAFSNLYLILNSNFQILESSDEYKKSILASEDYQGKIFFDCLPETSSQELLVKNTLRASLKGVSETKEEDVVLIQKNVIRKEIDEELNYWKCTNTPILDKQDNILFIIHRLEEIPFFKEELSSNTNKKRIRSDTENKEIWPDSSHDELERKNEELRYLNQKLEKASQITSHFFGNISHELRTPLTLIVGPLEKLLLDKTLLNYHKDLKVIEKNAHILLKLVNDLLDIAKLDTGKVEFNYSRVDLSKLVNQTTAHFDSFIKEQQINFILETPPSLPAEVDSEKVRRIIINLLSNAFKFTPENGTVKCRLYQQENEAVIMISDNGPGIPKNLREIIFERFFQPEGSITKEFIGFGVGLAIAKEFTTLHKGTISIVDAENETTFVVTLPLKAPPGTIVETSMLDISTVTKDLTSQIMAELKTHNGSYKKSSGLISTPILDMPLVLVVEDHKDTNEYICEVLQDNYRIARAFNGKEGFEIALDLLPDLIISDIMMPEVDGIQLVKMIRENSKLHEIPILILTAKAERDLSIKMLKLGANDVLTKPFFQTELLIRTQNLINLRKAKEKVQKSASQLYQSKITALWHLTLGIAQEIKNPLNFVINNTELSLEEVQEMDQILQRLSLSDEILKKEKVNNLLNEIKANLEVVLKQGKRADQIIQQMTEHALEKTEQRAPINIYEFIDASLSICEQRLRQDFADFKVTLIKNYDQELPHISVDQYAILKCLYSILHNAYYSMREKARSSKNGYKPEITISLKNLIDNVEIRIKDNGEGIKQTQQSKIFSPFFTTKPIGSGLGLGLALCYHIIVHEHQGALNFFSEEGKGAEFIITLPI